LAALAAETPGCWGDYPDTARRGWIQERLGLSASRFWVITMNGRRDLVEFVEPQTREALLERAAQTRPGIGIEVTPALPLKALCDNANKPVDKSEIALCDNDNPPMEPDMQQATLLPDTASLATGPAVATVSAAELLQGAGVAVRYLVEPGAAEQALSELLTLPDTGPWGLDIETAPLPAFRQDSKAGLDPWRSSIRLVQVYPGGPTCYVFDVATLGLSALRELLQARAFVAHNAVFELKFLLHAGAAPARLGCTLLQDNALGNGRRSLAALVKERLAWAMDKTLQVSDWTAANLTGAQLEYAALDAVAAYQLARVQAPQLQERDRGRCYQLMRDAQLAIARLELAGCPFDTAAHTALIAQWQSTAEQARGELDSLLNGANPDSPLQLSKWLSANLPAETLAAWPRTATGQLQTDADALAGLTLPALEPLARYKTAIKGLSTYGKGYAARISAQSPGAFTPVSPLAEPQPGGCPVPAPTFKTRPAIRHSGRCSRRRRGVAWWLPTMGRSNCGLRRWYRATPQCWRFMNRGKTCTGKRRRRSWARNQARSPRRNARSPRGSTLECCSVPVRKGLQAFCKSSYGVDLSLAQADKARAAFFTAYPGLSAWQKQTRKAAELAKQVRTPGGRVRGLDKNIGTECLNTPVQGGAAECLLATLAALDVDSLGGRLVNIVHDELVVECAPEQAGAVSAAVEAAMVAGFLAIFPTGSTRDLVEAHSGPNWAAAKG
jgi:DNA polymerase-1